MTEKPIPNHVDDQMQVFFWEIDEFLILAACFGVGIMLGGMNTVLGIGCGFFAANIFKKYKAGGLPGQLNHLVHWKNIFNINSAFPRSGVRRIFK